MSGQRRDVAHLGQRVAGRLGEQQLGVGLAAPRATAATSVCDTKVVSTPNLPNWFCSSVMVEPNTAVRAHHMVARLEQPITSSRMALMPLDVAMAASVPSSAARRALEHHRRRVGEAL
jgi:hypothetical protein